MSVFNTTSTHQHLVDWQCHVNGHCNINSNYFWTMPCPWHLIVYKLHYSLTNEEIIKENLRTFNFVRILEVAMLLFRFCKSRTTSCSARVCDSSLTSAENTSANQLLIQGQGFSNIKASIACLVQ
jgi:hypothetical protein